MTVAARLLGPLRHGGFAAYAAGHLVSQAGAWTQQVALGWLAWELARSEAWLGIIAFCQFAPAVLLALFAGAATDRMDRLLLAAITQAAAAAVAALIFALTVAGLVTIEGLALLALLSGAVGSVGMPVKRVVVSALVPREDLAGAVSVNAIALNVGRFVGPALAGTLIAGPGVAWCFLVNALMLLPFVALLLALRRRRGAEPPPDRARPAVLAAIAEGIRHAARDPAIRRVLLLYLGYALLARPVVDQLPAIVGELRGGGAAELARLFQAFALGAALGGLALMQVSRVERLSLLFGLAYPAMAAGAALVVAPGAEGVALLGMALFGAGQVTSNVASQSLVQLGTPEALRGRVVAVHFMTFRGGAALGGLLVGAAAEMAGAGMVFGLAAAALALAGALYLRAR